MNCQLSTWKLYLMLNSVATLDFMFIVLSTVYCILMHNHMATSPRNSSSSKDWELWIYTYYNNNNKSNNKNNNNNNIYFDFSVDRVSRNISHILMHGFMLQGCCSDEFPTQVNPPCEGAGLVHVLVLVSNPSPQDALHAEKDPHEAQSPSTVKQN